MVSKLVVSGGKKRVKHPPVEKWAWLNSDVKAAVVSLIDQGIMSIGDHAGVQGEFEKAFAKMAGTRHALTMNSGTATLHSAYFAVGVGPRRRSHRPDLHLACDDHAILHCAATPVFCDMDPNSLTIDSGRYRAENHPPDEGDLRGARFRQRL